MCRGKNFSTVREFCGSPACPFPAQDDELPLTLLALPDLSLLDGVFRERHIG